MPYLRTLIASKNASLFGDFTRPGIGVEMAPKMRQSYPRLGPGKRAAQFGGGVGRDFPSISREMRAGHWGLTVAYFWALIAAKNASFFGDFRRPGTEVENSPGNEASLASIRGDKEGHPDWRRVGRAAPDDLGVRWRPI